MRFQRTTRFLTVAALAAVAVLGHFPGSSSLADENSAETILQPLPSSRSQASKSDYRVKVRLVKQPPTIRLAQPVDPNQTQPASEASPPELLPSSEATPQKPSHDPEKIDGIDIGIEPIGETDVSRRQYTEPKKLPPDYAAAAFDEETLHWSAAEIAWPLPATPSLAGEFCYRPLYFEEANLERYGTRRNTMQPFLSAARFYATIPALPYLAAADPPNDCRYERYPYQAGRSAPRVNELPPLSIKGGLVEAGTAVGLILLVP